MHPLAQVNRTLPQAAASSSDALANVLVMAITGDGKLHSQPLARIDRAMDREPAAFILEPEQALIFE
jgi:hypothetical protein